MSREAGQGSVAEARREQRFAVSLAASLLTENGVVPVRLLDLSCGGASFDARFAPAVGSRVTLLRERMEVEARVAWLRSGHCGLAFDRPIKATELFFQLGRHRHAAQNKAAASSDSRAASAERA